jgi:hypothetical protein
MENFDELQIMDADPSQMGMEEGMDGNDPG